MVIIKLKGGLGNQLFQYAYGRVLAIKNNVEVRYEFEGKSGDTAREYKLGFFNTKAPFPTPEESRKVKKSYGMFSTINDLFKKKILRQYNIGYVPSTLLKKSGYVEGYWQSYKYLNQIKKELLQEIQLKNPIDIKYAELIKQMRDTQSVSVHIRRGDYINDPKTKAEHYCFGIEYYNEAFEIIREKIKSPTLFIFSDDIIWAKDNVRTDIPTIFISDENILDYESFILATYCKNHIIANSSFSFWIAWLDQKPEKIVLAPKKWNNRYQSKYKDLLPPEWITI
jgi:hypothetical protein